MKRGTAVTVTDLRTGKKWNATLLHDSELTNTHVLVRRDSDGRQFQVGRTFITAYPGATVEARR